MSYLVNALKQSQQTAHSEQDHFAYQHEKQLKLYRTLIFSLSGLVLVGGFTFVGYLSGHYLQSSIAQKQVLSQTQNNAQEYASDQAVKPQSNGNIEQPMSKETTPIAEQSRPVIAQTVQQPANMVIGQPLVNTSNMMSPVQYQWMSVQAGLDANGQPLYRQQLVPVVNQQMMNALPATIPQQVVAQPSTQIVQQPASEDLTQYRVLGKPLPKPKEQDSELAGVSKELKEAFAQAVAETEVQQPHHVTASSRNSARATPIELLPKGLQSSLPSLRYQAHIYATDSDKRWIKLNNRELYEGDSIGVLELLEITPEQALFNYDGYEFSMKAMQDWLP
ncbi:hypothetical protein PSECIP111951_03119 [Pseudoalteromonas holothuriae]|uniref:Type II secretion system protein GspB C-terminal domain-containing protein n=1 Tax=Pseudoalteromonas holothuriae TaxID=2963714 RepID=A0A9W4QYQ7_9GAMM|nr:MULTISPECIES: general secretion pathway protein GspB [unclassified Pseudoalteromonas]CAH9059404.1 hypothetical protein PSECIP111854_02399 [Pseudoalteromonas sp. CIP111854]CAH9064385.1 hypothetical protein PSECIP111951_03119 [Pseudoalteromonas sp. CIP111951]